MRTATTLLVVALAVPACTRADKPESSPPPAADASPKAEADAAAQALAAAAAGPKPVPAPPDVAAAPADAQKTPSGLASKVLTAGTGTNHPGSEDTVEVNYTGWTSDGKMFDSSLVRGTPIKFRLNGVIKGWTEGIQLMTVGEKRRFWIPPELAFGATPPPGAPAGTLVFEVELIGFTAGPKPLPVPPDVAKAPKDAKRTKSGLAYKVLQKGTGSKHPQSTDSVQVHYSGWTTDGKMFDSSVQRGQPTTFPLAGVIKGWTEGLQLMSEGEKTRFWIPSELAYNNQPGRPAGMLVFDVELLKIM